MIVSQLILEAKPKQISLLMIVSIMTTDPLPTFANKASKVLSRNFENH